MRMVEVTHIELKSTTEGSVSDSLQMKSPSSLAPQSEDLMDPVEASGVCVHTVNTEPSEPVGDFGEWTASTADTGQDLSPLLVVSLLVLSAYISSFSLSMDSGCLHLFDQLSSFSLIFIVAWNQA